MKWISFLLILCSCTCWQLAAGQDMGRFINNSYTDQQKADSLFKYARKYFQRAKFDSANLWLDAGLPRALNTYNDTLIAKYYVEKGNLAVMQSNTAQAMNYLWNAQAWSVKTFHYLNLNSIYILLAKCHVRLNDSDSALLYFRKSEELSAIHNSYRRWLTYVEMGSFFASAYNFSEAEKYFEKAYYLTKEKGIRGDHGLTMYNLANFYASRKKVDKFALLLNEQQEFTKTTKKDFSKDPVHSFLYIAWAKETPLESKVEFFKNVRDKLLAEKFLTNGSLVNEEIASLYEKEGRFDEALKYVEESIVIAKLESNASNMYIYNKMAYRLLKKGGRLKEANDVADKVFALKDSITARQNMEMAMELDAKYLAEKKEKEIALLNANNEISRKEIALLNSQKELDIKTISLLSSQKKLSDVELLRQMELQLALARENELMDSVVNREKAYSLSMTREKEKEAALNAALGRENDLKVTELIKEKNLRRILIGGAFLLLMAAGIILFQYKKQRSKSIVIQKQSDDMQVLMKEIHHRVKNNLQVISSLLDLQSMTIADSQASEAVKEGKNRVQSMALIHQNLYSEGNIKGIKTKEYINNLLQNLCDSYNVTNDKVKVKTQIDDLNLDVDTMIPLGLVLNELVSNSLKYAFKDGRQGELSIVLKEEHQHLLLKVSDNGAGYPDGLNAKESKSFGMKMIKAFAQKLKANLDVYNNNGAVVEMQITKYKLA